jgi:hypothetical protein
VAVLDPTAARGPGLYEAGNPAPVEGVDTASADGLVNALTALNTPVSKYGEYAIVLGAQPDYPARITLGGGGSGTAPDAYPLIEQTALVINGTAGAGVTLPAISALWTLEDGNTLSYGDGVYVMPDSAEPPVIDTQPEEWAAYPLNYAQAVPLEVAAHSTDGGVISYQWWWNSADDNSGGTLIIGETAETYAPPTTFLGNRFYYCVVTNTNDKAFVTKSVSLPTDTASVTVFTLTMTTTEGIWETDAYAATPTSYETGESTWTSAFAPATQNHAIQVEGYVKDITFTATLSTEIPPAIISYNDGNGGAYSETEPVITFDGPDTTGSVTFGIKVAVGDGREYTWGPYSIDALRYYWVVRKPLTYTAIDGVDFTALRITGGDSTLSFLPSHYPTLANVLVIGGGGSGGTATSGADTGGGGGGGGYVYAEGLGVADNGIYTVTIGAGGLGGTNNYNNGGTSVFWLATELPVNGLSADGYGAQSPGGGYGGQTNGAYNSQGGTGASSGGSAGINGTSGRAANTTLITATGLFGSSGGASGYSTGGGGGGAGGAGGVGGVGGVGSPSPGGASGAGKANSITGASYTYAAGGQGGAYSQYDNRDGNAYGKGGGGGYQGGLGYNGAAGVVIVRWAK